MMSLYNCIEDYEKGKTNGNSFVGTDEEDVNKKTILIKVYDIRSGNYERDSVITNFDKLAIQEEVDRLQDMVNKAKAFLNEIYPD